MIYTECQVCGAEIDPADTRGPHPRKYCSTHCRNRRPRAPRTYDPARERAKRDKRARRSKRQYSDLSREYVAALYRKVKHCPLCDVALTAEPFLPNSRELDHIIPLHAGGTHSIGNVRIICRSCNAARPKDGSDYTGPVTLWAQDPLAVPSVGAVSGAARRKAEAKTRALHREREAREKREMAVFMRACGYKWREIADHCGYASASAAGGTVAYYFGTCRVASPRGWKRSVSSVR